MPASNGWGASVIGNAAIVADLSGHEVDIYHPGSTMHGLDRIGNNHPLSIFADTVIDDLAALELY